MRGFIVKPVIGQEPEDDIYEQMELLEQEIKNYDRESKIVVRHWPCCSRLVEPVFIGVILKTYHRALPRQGCFQCDDFVCNNCIGRMTDGTQLNIGEIFNNVVTVENMKDFTEDENLAFYRRKVFSHLEPGKIINVYMMDDCVYCS